MVELQDLPKASRETSGKVGSQGWRPSLSVYYTHSGSCQLMSSRKETHKGNVLSYSSLFLVYWTNNDFTPPVPAVVKALQAALLGS